MTRALLLAVCIALAGCATAQANGSTVEMGDQAVEPPMGYMMWCWREPWQKACGGDGVAR